MTSPYLTDTNDVDVGNEPALKPDVQIGDRREHVSLMEPAKIGDAYRLRGRITDLAFDLAQKSSGFKHSLPANILASLADLVRSMNCYYSKRLKQ